MTQIAAILHQSRYRPRHPWVMALDGVPLDEWLATRKVSDDPYVGLVPALGNLTDPEEASLAWQRTLPLPGLSAVAPLLICPEHLDLSCMVVLAEVFHGPDVVTWRRLGLNHGENTRPDELGQWVEWLPTVEPLRFGRDAYLACLERFHLLRLCQDLKLDGKTLALTLIHGAEHTLISGTLALSVEGLLLQPEAGPPLLLETEWLPQISPISQVSPAQQKLFASADYALTLTEPKLLSRLRSTQQ